MTFVEFAKRAQKFTIDNSPLLLTAIGVTGTITTAYLTGKASFKAAEVLRIDDQAISNSYERPLKDQINAVWKFYIPAALSGTATLAAIIGANQIGTRRTAALAAAFSLSEKAVSEYKDKVLETFGERKAQTLRDDIAQERVNSSPVEDRSIIIAGSGDVLCYEAFTDRYFQSSMEEIKKAQNDLNYRINHDSYASLSDFYDLLGLPRTSMSDEVGWTADKLMDLNISTTLSTTGKPCLAIDYQIEPVRDYFRLSR